LSLAGFLSTGDSNAPGNYAVLDQVAALHWVKENIAAFDGDPNDVTLIGHGHGAALVNLLMVSPVTKGNKAEQLYTWIGDTCVLTTSRKGEFVYTKRQSPGLTVEPLNQYGY